MPAKSKTTKATLVTTTSFAMSARSSHSKLAWELMQLLTEDPDIQQTLFAQSQGISVMPQVVKSRSSKDLLQVDDFGTDSLTNQTLNRIMEQAVESSLKRGVRKARLLDWQCIARSGCREPFASNSEGD